MIVLQISNNMEKLNICTYNCKNIKTSVGEVQELCKVADIVFLQETWLSETDLPLLNVLSPDHYALGTSRMDQSNLFLLAGPMVAWQFYGVNLLPVYVKFSNNLVNID